MLVVYQQEIAHQTHNGKVLKNLEVKMQAIMTGLLGSRIIYQSHQF